MNKEALQSVIAALREGRTPSLSVEDFPCFSPEATEGNQHVEPTYLDVVAKSLTADDAPTFERALRAVGGAVAVLTTNRHATITEFVDVIVQINAPSKNQKDSVFRSAQPMASLYEQALLVIADALVMKMAAESGAPESELFKRHANLE